MPNIYITKPIFPSLHAKIVRKKLPITKLKKKYRRSKRLILLIQRTMGNYNFTQVLSAITRNENDWKLKIKSTSVTNTSQRKDYHISFSLPKLQWSQKGFGPLFKICRWRAKMTESSKWKSAAEKSDAARRIKIRSPPPNINSLPTWKKEKGPSFSDLTSPRNVVFYSGLKGGGSRRCF